MSTPGTPLTKERAHQLTVTASNMWTTRDNIYNRALKDNPDGQGAREAIWHAWRKIPVEQLEEALDRLLDETPDRTPTIGVVRKKALTGLKGTTEDVSIEDLRQACDDWGHAWSIWPTSTAAILFAAGDIIDIPPHLTEAEQKLPKADLEDRYRRPLRLPEELDRLPQEREMTIPCSRCGQTKQMTVREYRAHWDDAVRANVEPDQLAALDERIAP